MNNKIVLEIETSPEMVQAIQEWCELIKVEKYYEISTYGNTCMSITTDNDNSKLSLLSLIKSSLIKPKQ